MVIESHDGPIDHGESESEGVKMLGMVT